MPETKRVRRSAQPAPAARQRTVRLFNGDSVEVLRQLPDNSVDSVVCDPPYGLSKEPDMAEVMRHWLAGDDYKHKGGGFMGKSWDSFVPGPAIWRECLRVLKPGGHLLAFFGSRTYDMGTLAIRLAGFEIRDQIMWIYGSGFPKSLDVSKAIDKQDASNSKREKQLIFTKFIRDNEISAAFINEITQTNMGSHYTTSASQPSIATREHFEKLRPFLKLEVSVEMEKMVDERSEESMNMKNRDVIGSDTKARSTAGNSALPICGEGETVYKTWDITAPATDEAKQWEGWGTALKPAHEPICVARKPLAGTVAANVLAHGTGGVNIDGCRIEGRERTDYGLVNSRRTQGSTYSTPSDSADFDSTKGRWPANFVHDGLSEEWSRYFYCAKASKADRNYGLSGDDHAPADLVDRQEGSAGMDNPRAGAGRTSGSKNPHPTVKPIALMEWLVRLVTPPGGVVLDPFMGSGSTGIAAVKQGFKFVGCELSEDYFKVAQERIQFARDDK